jgi:glycosyltransferase involved in cell wall biosynthesis
MRISVVTPIFNEEQNIPLLYERLTKALKGFKSEYEIIAVDDGSRDKSREALSMLAKKDPCLKLVFLRNNFGQTSALSAGIEMASGDTIVLIDSDLENDPADIGRIVAKIDEGYGVVSGWRKERWEGQTVTRKIPSFAANWLISYMTGVKLHDYGCTLKGYRRDIIQNIPLYGEMHRFIPAYASMMGAGVAEIEVNYAPRIHGKSNYGFSRLFRVIPDLILLNFMEKYMNRPMHFFGLLGFYSFGAGLLAIAGAVYARFAFGTSLIQTPLPTFAAMCVIVGFQLFVMGLLAEMLMRTYYESQHKRPYVVRETVNI